MTTFPCAPRAIVALFAAFALFTAIAAVAADTSAPPPIRVLRVGHGRLPALKQNITASVEACRAVKHLPAGPVILPSDAVLSQIGLLETEELFDGARWAVYEVQRSIAADASNGCQLAMFAHRTATVEQACEWRIRGSNALIGAMVDFESPSPAAPQVQDDKLSAQSCSTRRRVSDDSTAGLPSEDAGGTRCVWSSALIARSMAKVAALAAIAQRGGDDQGADTCLYEKRPYYEVAGARRAVVLKTRGALRGSNGVDITTIFGEAKATEQQLSAFSDSQPIPVARFTRASVDAFVRLPAKAAVGVQ
jgi:hypothetical protein